MVYQFDDGTLWTHATQSITNGFDLTTLWASFFGLQTTAHVQYGGKVIRRGGPQHYSGACEIVFNEGVVRNVAQFHKNIVEGYHRTRRSSGPWTAR